MASVAPASAPISLPALPYPENALDPVISAKTISFHYGKHHRAYVDTTNKLIEPNFFTMRRRRGTIPFIGNASNPKVAASRRRR
jgi:superoxide dismutase